METAIEVSVPTVDSNSNQKGESNMETAIEVQAVPEVQSAPALPETPKTPLEKAEERARKNNERARKHEEEQQAAISKWSEDGKQFVGQLEQAQWQIGDWLVAGNRYYPSHLRGSKKQLLKVAERITGYSSATLYRTLQVSKAFPVSQRCEFSALTWEHFHAVSGKKMDHKKALELLRDAMAREPMLSAAKMKEEMRGEKLEVEGHRVTFRISDSGYDALRTLAYARHNRDGDTPAVLEEIVLAALSDYLNNPNVAKEIEDYDAALVTEEIKREIERSLDGKLAWKAIEGIMRELTDGNDEKPEPQEIVARFEKCTHKVKGYEEPQEWQFTYRTFLSALKNSRTFAKYFSKSDCHDFGVNLSVGKTRTSSSSQMKALCNDTLVAELKTLILGLPFACADELVEKIDWTIPALFQYSRYTSSAVQKVTLVLRALTALRKEGKVKVVKGRIQKLEAAAPVTSAAGMPVAEYDKVHANDAEEAA